MIGCLVSYSILKDRFYTGTEAEIPLGRKIREYKKTKPYTVIYDKYHYDILIDINKQLNHLLSLYILIFIKMSYSI